MSKNKNIFYILYALIALTYFLGLFVHQTADAAKYAAIGRNILESGDWINLKARDMAYDQKPPLLFWLAAISFKLFGYHDWAFKIPTLLFSILGIFSIFRLGKLLYNKNIGKLAALVYVTTEMCFLYNMDIHTDALLTANITFGIWQLMEYLKHKRWYNFVLGFVGVGLAMMSKGPIALALAVFAIGSHLLLHRDFKNIFNPRWFLGALILFIVITPALIGLYNQFGWQGIIFFFWKNMAGRIDGSYIGGNKDYFFYLHTMAYILLPWSIFALVGLFMEFREHTLRRWKILDSDEFVTLGGSVLFLVILSVARQKAPHYMMIVTPLISIITAKWIIRIQETSSLHKLKKILNTVHYTVLILLWLLTFLIPIYIWPTKSWVIWFTVAMIFIGFCIYFFRTKYFTHFKVSTVLTASALNIILFTVMLPSMFDYMASVHVCKTYNLEAGNKDILFSYNCQNDEIFFYAKGESHFLRNSNQLPNIILKNNSWIYTDQEGLQDILSLKPRLEKLYTYDHNRLSKPNPKFIWPSTRKQALKQRYLVKIGSEDISKTTKIHFSNGNGQCDLVQ